MQNSGNDDYTTGNLLDYLYQQKYYELNDTDLSRQTNTTIPGQIRRRWWCNNVFVSEKQQETLLNFPLDSLIVTII